MSTLAVDANIFGTFTMVPVKATAPENVLLAVMVCVVVISTALPTMSVWILPKSNPPRAVPSSNALNDFVHTQAILVSYPIAIQPTPMLAVIVKLDPSPVYIAKFVVVVVVAYEATTGLAFKLVKSAGEAGTATVYPK